jgi:signal transduction histidine kinase
VLDDHGLGVALRRYINDYTESRKIAVDLRLCENESNNLPSGVQIALYRILQEALTNVARHSGAKKVGIRFARLAAAVEVSVIDADAVAVSSHRLGIQSMRERAAMLGGTVRFIPQRKGTRMLVRVPLANQDSETLAE